MVVKLINIGNVVKLFVLKFIYLLLYDFYLHNNLYILVLLDTSSVIQSSKCGTKYFYKKEATDRVNLFIKKFDSCAARYIQENLNHHMNCHLAPQRLLFVDFYSYVN